MDKIRALAKWHLSKAREAGTNQEKQLHEEFYNTVVDLGSVMTQILKLVKT